MPAIPQYFLKQWGEPTQRIEADEAVLAQLAPSVPPLLINYWRHLGFSVFKDGLMSLCNPLEWKPITSVNCCKKGSDIRCPVTVGCVCESVPVFPFRTVFVRRPEARS